MITNETSRLLSLITTPLLVVDRHGKIVFENSALVDMIRLTDETLVGRMLSDIVSDSNDRISSQLRLFSGGDNWLPGSFVFRYADGTLIELPCKGTVVQSPAKGRAKLIGIQFDQGLDLRDQDQKLESLNQDIQHRREVEERLRLTSFALDQVGDSMYILSGDGRLQDVNEAACRQLGYTREELLRLSVANLDPAYSPSKFKRRWQKVEQRGRLSFETSHRNRSGKLIPVELMLTAFEYQGQQCHVAFARDISERKQAETALLESEERLRQAVLAAEIGIFDHDHRTDTIYWSPQQRRIHGWGPDEPINLPAFMTLIPSDDVEAIAATVRHAHDPASDGEHLAGR